MRRDLLAENINAKHSERDSNTAILIRGMYSEIFFSEIAFKITICFLNRTDSETGRAELLPDMHFRSLR